MIDQNSSLTFRCTKTSGQLVTEGKEYAVQKINSNRVYFISNRGFQCSFDIDLVHKDYVNLEDLMLLKIKGNFNNEN